MARQSQARKEYPSGTDRYQQLVAHTRVGIFRSTPQGRFTDVNPALVHMLGYASATEVLALKLPSELYVDPAQRAWLRATYEASGVLDGVEVRWKTKGGEPITVGLYARALRDARGRVTGYEGMVMDVTARTRAEEALRQSEERYRLLSQSISDYAFSFRIDAQGDLVLEWLTDSFTTLTGYPVADLIGTPNPLQVYTHPDDLDRVLQTLRGLAPGTLTVCECRIVTKSGEVRWVRSPVRAVADAAGRLVRLYGAARDMTDEKHMRDALVQSEQRYRSIFEACPDLVYVTDASGQLLDANPALVQWAGVSLEHVRHRHVLEVFAANNREALEQPLAQLAQGQAVTGVQVEVRNAAGERRTLEVNALPVPEQGTILSIARDITARTEAERALKLSQQLRERITEAMPDLVYLYDLRDQRTRWINQQIVTLLGYPPEKLQGQAGPLFGDLLHPDDVPVVAARVQDLASADPRTPVETECRVRHANGEYRWLRVRETVFQRTPEGEPQEVLGTAQDITERKRLQRLLQEQPIDPQALGARLQQFRESLGMNQKQLGAYLGDYHQKQISSYETGEVMVPLEVLLTLRAKGHPLEVVLGTGSTAVLDETLRYLSASHRERVVARQLAETLLHVLARDVATIEGILGELEHPPKPLATSQRKLLEGLAAFTKTTR
jgi:PAS domain S-box-containing protein